MKPLAGGMVDNARVAFKYLLKFPDVVMIPGIERMEEIEEIAAIFEGPTEMTQAELQEMERIKSEPRCEVLSPLRLLPAL